MKVTSLLWQNRSRSSNEHFQQIESPKTIVKWPMVTHRVVAANRATQLPFARTTPTPDSRSKISGQESRETKPVSESQFESSGCLQWPGLLSNLRSSFLKMGTIFKSATHWPLSCTETRISRKYASTPRAPRRPVLIGRVQPVNDK